MIVNRKGRQVASNRRFVAAQRRPPDPMRLLPPETMNLFHFDNVPVPAEKLFDDASFRLSSAWKTYLEPRLTHLFACLNVIPSVLSAANVAVLLKSIELETLPAFSDMRTFTMFDEALAVQIKENAAQEVQDQRKAAKKAFAEKTAGYMTNIFQLLNRADASGKRRIGIQIQQSTSAHMCNILRRALADAGINEETMSTTALHVLVAGPLDFRLVSSHFEIFEQLLTSICSGTMSCKLLEFPDRGPTPEQLQIVRDIVERHRANVEADRLRVQCAVRVSPSAVSAPRPIRTSSKSGIFSAGRAGETGVPLRESDTEPRRDPFFGVTDDEYLSDNVDGTRKMFVDFDWALYNWTGCVIRADNVVLKALEADGVSENDRRNLNEQHACLSWFLNAGEVTKRVLTARIQEIITDTRKSSAPDSLLAARRVQYRVLYDDLMRTNLPKMQNACLYYAKFIPPFRRELTAKFPALTSRHFDEATKPVRTDEESQLFGPLPEPSIAVAAANAKSSADLLPNDKVQYEFHEDPNVTLRWADEPLGYTVRKSSLRFYLLNNPVLPAEKHLMFAAGKTPQERLNQFTRFFDAVIHYLGKDVHNRIEAVQHHVQKNMTDVLTHEFDEMKIAGVDYRNTRAEPQYLFHSTPHILTSLEFANSTTAELTSRYQDSVTHLKTWCKYYLMKLNADCVPDASDGQPGQQITQIEKKQSTIEFAQQWLSLDSRETDGRLETAQTACDNAMQAVKALRAHYPSDNQKHAGDLQKYYGEQKNDTLKEKVSAAIRSTTDLRTRAVTWGLLVTSQPMQMREMTAEFKRFYDVIATKLGADAVKGESKDFAEQYSEADAPMKLAAFLEMCAAWVNAYNSIATEEKQILDAEEVLHIQIQDVDANIDSTIKTTYAAAIEQWQKESSRIRSFVTNLHTTVKQLDESLARAQELQQIGRQLQAHFPKRVDSAHNKFVEDTLQKYEAQLTSCAMALAQARFPIVGLRDVFRKVITDVSPYVQKLVDPSTTAEAIKAKGGLTDAAAKRVIVTTSAKNLQTAREQLAAYRSQISDFYVILQSVESDMPKLQRPSSPDSADATAWLKLLIQTYTQKMAQVRRECIEQHVEVRKIVHTLIEFDNTRQLCAATLDVNAEVDTPDSLFEIQVNASMQTMTNTTRRVTLWSTELQALLRRSETVYNDFTVEFDSRSATITLQKPLTRNLLAPPPAPQPIQWRAAALCMEKVIVYLAAGRHPIGYIDQHTAYETADAKLASILKSTPTDGPRRAKLDQYVKLRAETKREIDYALDACNDAGKDLDKIYKAFEALFDDKAKSDDASFDPEFLAFKSAAVLAGMRDPDPAIEVKTLPVGMSLLDHDKVLDEDFLVYEAPARVLGAKPHTPPPPPPPVHDSVLSTANLIQVIAHASGNADIETKSVYPDDTTRKEKRPIVDIPADDPSRTVDTFLTHVLTGIQLVSSSGASEPAAASDESKFTAAELADISRLKTAIATNIAKIQDYANHFRNVDAKINFPKDVIRIALLAGKAKADAPLTAVQATEAKSIQQGFENQFEGIFDDLKPIDQWTQDIYVAAKMTHRLKADLKIANGNAADANQLAQAVDNAEGYCASAMAKVAAITAQRRFDNMDFEFHRMMATRFADADAVSEAQSNL